MKASFENPSPKTSAATVKVLTAVACAGMVMATARDAHAYLDPGTGSFVLQALIAGLLGAGFAVKTFWRSIKAFFSRIFGKGKDSPDGP